MTARTLTVHNKAGLHARPAMLFVQTATHFKSKIKVTREGRTVDAKSILGVLSLGAGKNSVIEVEAEGADETAALDALKTLLTIGRCLFQRLGRDKSGSLGSSTRLGF
jgi:phosphocarrier protein HPr